MTVTSTLCWSDTWVTLASAIQSVSAVVLKALAAAMCKEDKRSSTHVSFTDCALMDGHAHTNINTVNGSNIVLA